MLDHLDLAVDFHTNRDLILAQALGQQLAADECSDVEIWETISEAFPDTDLQVYALHAALTELTVMQSRKAHRLRRLQSWRTR